MWFWVVSVVVWGPPRTPQGIRNNFGELYFWPHSRSFLDPKKGLDDAPRTCAGTLVPGSSQK
jgi:hypothetical protein